MKGPEFLFRINERLMTIFFFAVVLSILLVTLPFDGTDLLNLAKLAIHLASAASLILCTTMLLLGRHRNAGGVPKRQE